MGKYEIMLFKLRRQKEFCEAQKAEAKTPALTLDADYPRYPDPVEQKKTAGALPPMPISDLLDRVVMDRTLERRWREIATSSREARQFDLVEHVQAMLSAQNPTEGDKLDNVEGKCKK